MKAEDIEQLVGELRSDDTPRNVLALSLFASDAPDDIGEEVVLRVVGEGVEALLRSPEPDLIYLQLRRFGRYALNSAREAYSSASHSPARTMLAFLLVDAGEIYGIEELLREVADDGRYAVPAAVSLARSEKSDLGDLITEMLLKRVPQTVDGALPTDSTDRSLELIEAPHAIESRSYDERIRLVARASQNRFISEALKDKFPNATET